jgi:rRNA maturation RNase YbeY
MAGSTGGNKINFHFLHPFRWFTNRKLLKSFIRRSLKAEGHKIGQLNIVFCSDDYLLEINKKYLNHTDYTDIITFNLEPNSADVIGDIFISVPRILENSIFLKVRRAEELHRVIFHGILHLCGFNDKTAAEKKKMTGKEDEWLRKYQSYVSREIRST